MYDFLMKIIQGFPFGDYDYNPTEAQFATLAKDNNYATGFIVEKDYIPPNLTIFYIYSSPRESIRVTPHGATFIESYQQQKGRTPMNYDQQNIYLKHILAKFKETGQLNQSDFTDIDNSDYLSLLSIADKRKYIENLDFSSGGKGNQPRAIWADEAILTPLGVDFINNKDSSNTHNEIHVNAPVYNSAFGSHNSVTNNTGTTLKEMLTIIESLDVQDKALGQELVEELKSNKHEPGFLKKFDNLLGKYPNLATAVNNSLMLIATAGVAFIP